MNEDKNIIFLGNVFPTKTRKNPNQGRVYSPEGLAPCLNTTGGGNREPMILVRANTEKGYEVMGFDDSDVDLLMQNGISNTQLYKMAGNSIVVNVLEFIFCQIFDDSNKIWV